MSVLPNLKHAAFNCETIIIGGGEFSAKEVLDEFVNMKTLLKRIKSHLEVDGDEAMKIINEINLLLGGPVGNHKC